MDAEKFITDSLKALDRLSTGRNNTVLSLLFGTEVPDNDMISRINAANISEIKRDKDGGVQVKFFDRTEAVAKLYEIAKAIKDEDRANNFLVQFSSKIREETEESD
jgi:hypothetical protein